MAAPHLVLDSDAPGDLDGRHLRAVTFQDVRLRYVNGVLRDRDIPAAGARAVVVGGGRGLLARGLARTGMEVLSVDPSPTATELATRASHGEDLPVTFTSAPPERPGPPDGAFDVAYYADTFEITDDLDAVLAAAARLLRPGGAMVYDTVNRTPLSRLVYLGAFQRFPGSRIMPPGRYTAARLRPPADLAARMADHGLTVLDTCGFKPSSAAALVKATRARRTGRVTDERLPSMVEFELDPDGPPLVTYLGHARRD
ncbi:methyltransferase domain-containing protein [Actinomadura sp. KC345]|uniref:methyltransferase domain-containing protein n=1 Tax=Actinomadura sp. KC345 TaxID=2530371 RepID=UPI001052842C|nr:methyltransferase domain-containing protein [Actinomadura sp. KC345]TDC45290.1 methyltransferase domain-containing protein [Actinomadura sp. KC345]